MSAAAPGQLVEGDDVVVTNSIPDTSGKSTLTTPAVTATTTGGDTDTAGYWARNIFGTFRDAFVIINVTAASGTGPSITFFIDVLGPDGVTWFNIFAFTAITAVGSSNKLIGQHFGSGLLGSSVRVRWGAPTGTTPSFTFTVQAILES